MIDLSHLTGSQGEVWDRLLALAEDRPEGWTLIGAQMVIALAYEHGRTISAGLPLTGGNALPGRLPCF